MALCAWVGAVKMSVETTTAILEASGTTVFVAIGTGALDPPSRVWVGSRPSQL